MVTQRLSTSILVHRPPFQLLIQNVPLQGVFPQVTGKPQQSMPIGPALSPTKKSQQFCEGIMLPRASLILVFLHPQPPLVSVSHGCAVCREHKASRELQQLMCWVSEITEFKARRDHYTNQSDPPVHHRPLFHPNTPVLSRIICVWFLGNLRMNLALWILWEPNPQYEATEGGIDGKCYLKFSVNCRQIVGSA